MFTKTALGNGLRVVSVPMPQVKSVTALVMVGTGSRYETSKINGLSHFIEHMIFKGTKTRPSSLDITSLIDGIGGNFNAFTSKEFTGFYVKAESTHLDLLLNVLSDMLKNSLFDAVEMDKVRGVIMEEINMYEDQPQARVGELFEQLLFPQNSLGWRVIGEKKNIKSVTRDDLLLYVQQMYHSRSMVVTVAGNIDSGRGQNDIGNYFADIKDGKENKYEKFVFEQKKPASLVHFKKTDQAHLVLGVRGYDLNHPDRYVLDVLGTILGGNMSSRLFLEVREKRGLAYYVHSESEEFLDCGYFSVNAGLRLEAVEEAIKVILGEFEKVRANPPSPEELRRAKDFATGRMTLALEDSYKVASFYGMQELLKKEIETPEEVLEKIRAVTAEDVKRVANDIFVNQNLNLALIGPFQNENQFDNILRI